MASNTTSPTEVSNLADNKGPWLYAIFCSLSGLAFIFVSLRFVCRFQYVKILQSSDYLIVAAMVTSIGMSVMIHMQIKTGMGRHIEYAQSNPGMLVESMKVGYAENLLYQISVGIVKSSILAQYHYIAGSRAQKLVIIALWVFVVAFCTVATMAAVLQCIPISTIFDPHVFPSGCWNMAAVNIVTSSINIAVDLVIFVMPIPVLAKLNMERRKKLNLLATYFFGSLSIAASSLRISSMVLWTGATDFTYVAAIIPVYDAVEIDTGIICACIPLLRPLIRGVVSGRQSALSEPTQWVRTRSVEQGQEGLPFANRVSLKESTEDTLIGQAT